VSLLLAVALELLLAFAAALVIPWRPVASLCVVAVLAVPFIVRTDQPLAIFYLAVYATMIGMRTVELLRTPTPMTPLRRIWHVQSPFDTRAATSRARGREGRALLVGLAWFAACFVASGIGVVASVELDGLVRLVIRWGTCAFVFLAMFEAFGRLLQAGYAPLGIRPPAIHDNAWAATSVREFWGERWNMAVGTWLRAHCYEPLRRRGHPGAGVAAAFLASAAIHCYLVLACLGLFWSGVMALFFVVQIVVMLVERALGVRRWRPAAARAWTIGALLVASPLFCEPVFRMFDPLVAVLMKA
jgi:hypothetical protein